jgi:hypothetical protein
LNAGVSATLFRASEGLGLYVANGGHYEESAVDASMRVGVRILGYQTRVCKVGDNPDVVRDGILDGIR